MRNDKYRITETPVILERAGGKVNAPGWGYAAPHQQFRDLICSDAYGSSHQCALNRCPPTERI
jgi:hypothetical protein